MNHPMPARLGSLFVALALIALGRPVHADEIEAFAKASEGVTPAVMGSHATRYQDNDSYLERWMLTLERNDGGWMQLNFVLTNIGPGTANAGVTILRWAPPLADPTGKRTFYHWHASRDEVSAKTKGLDLRFEDSSLTLKNGVYEVKMSIWGYELEAKITAIARAWRPGTGEIRFPGSGRVSIHTLPTDGRFEARERTHGGAWTTFRGRAFGEHALMTVPPHKLADRWTSFVGRQGPYRVTFLELDTPESFGNERFGYLLVTRGKQVVFSSRRALVQKAKTRGAWKVPTAFEVVAGGARLRVKLGPRFHKEDVLATVPKLIRAVVRFWLQPMKFYNRAKFELTLPGQAPIRGRHGWTVVAPMKKG